MLVMLAVWSFPKVLDLIDSMSETSDFQTLLGHNLMKEGILPDPENVAEFPNWPVTKAMHGVRGIQGVWELFLPFYQKRQFQGSATCSFDQKVSHLKELKSAKRPLTIMVTGITSSFGMWYGNLPYLLVWHSPAGLVCW